MVGRYMVICSEHLGSLPEQSRQIMAVASASLDLQPIFEQADIVVLTDSKQSYVTLSRSTGIVLGDLFARHNERRLDALADADSEALVRSAGASLMAHYWGAYVAIVCDRPELGPHILRAPSGDVPCYQTNFGGLRLFFSHLDIIDALGLVNAAVDFEAVAQMLSCQVARSTRTCLLGVQELLPGTRTSRSRGAWPSETIWTPWTFAAPDRQIARRADAVDEMRETALSCARSWASTCSSPLLELSGGLDSSIVGACMAAAGAVGPCVTMVTPDPGADERRYAAAVAARIGAPLMAVPLQVADVDIANLTKLRYPRPVGHFLSRIADDLFERASHDLGADSFFGGSGGDYILCYLGTSAPVADVFLAKGFGTEFLRACSNLAALHRSTIWKVARLAYAKARSADRLQPKLSASFLNPDAVPEYHIGHPWLDAPPRSWPAKFQQILGLAASQESNDARERSRLAPARQLLLSQPFVELCLRVPSWMSISQGRNRAVARDAFGDLLPNEVLNRRSKGNFNAYNSLVYLRNRPVIRELVLDGMLVREGIVNKQAIAEHLDGRSNRTDESFGRLIQIACAEAWVQSWRSRNPVSSMRLAG